MNMDADVDEDIEMDPDMNTDKNMDMGMDTPHNRTVWINNKFFASYTNSGQVCIELSEYRNIDTRPAN